MKYEALPRLPYPHGAEPNLDDSARFLEIAEAAGATLIDNEIRERGGIPLYQALHDQFTAEIDTARYAVARDDEERVVGVSIYSIRPERRYAHIDVLAVEERMRGQKIGHGLLEFVTNHSRLRGADSLLLVSTPAAVNFYLDHGFENIDEDPDSDCPHMAKIIADQGIW